MDNKFRLILCEVTQKLNEQAILYGIGASTMLKLRGIDISVHDIDIMVREDQFLLAYTCLMTFCVELEVEPSNIYKTKHFKRLSYNGIDIDLMSGISIVHDLGIFSFAFDKAEQWIKINNTSVPICFIEDWFIFYHLMPNRIKTINCIKSYFISHPINKPRLLELMELSVPKEIVQGLSMYIDN